MANGNIEDVHGSLDPAQLLGFLNFNSFHAVGYLSVVPGVLQ